MFSESINKHQFFSTCHPAPPYFFQVGVSKKKTVFLAVLLHMAVERQR